MTSEVSSRILYQSAACLVVNKLSGEAVEGAGPGMADLPRNLAAALPANQAAAGALPLPEAVHRLDVPVTGCVLFALSKPALVFLNAAFGGGKDGPSNEPAPFRVEKHYWAIVETPLGETPVPESAELVHWIQFDPRKNKSAAWDEPGPGRKKAVLKYHVAGKGQNYWFLEIELITGRHHQIRAQLARLGLRIKGDLKYGARRSEKGGGIRLHARSLSFPDPEGEGGRITVRADPPLQDNLWLAFEAAVKIET
jgi:23S rRNA pseudouridine1911/1915/1917 synthase